MNKEFLIKLAATVLATEHGSGRWVTWVTPVNRKWKTETPLRGLEVGEAVYSYDEDEDAIVENTVAYMHEEVGYVFVFCPASGPRLEGVDARYCSTTIKGAILKNKSDIDHSLSWLHDKAEALALLEGTLEKHKERVDV